MHQEPRSFMRKLNQNARTLFHVQRLQSHLSRSPIL